MYNSDSTYVEIYMENNENFPSPFPTPTQLPRGNYFHWLVCIFSIPFYVLDCIFRNYTYILIFNICGIILYVLSWKVVFFFFLPTNNMSLEIFFCQYI